MILVCFIPLPVYDSVIVTTRATSVATTDPVATHGVDDSGNNQSASTTPSRQSAVAQTPSQSIGFSNLGKFIF